MIIMYVACGLIAYFTWRHFSPCFFVWRHKYEQFRFGLDRCVLLGFDWRSGKVEVRVLPDIYPSYIKLVSPQQIKPMKPKERLSTKIDFPDPNFNRRPYYDPSYEREHYGMMIFTMLSCLGSCLIAILVILNKEKIDSVPPEVWFWCAVIVCTTLGVRWLVKFLKSR